MKNRNLLIFCLILYFMVAGVLNVQAALTITNVSVYPNPFSPNGDLVKDITIISFVISKSVISIGLEFQDDLDKEGTISEDLRQELKNKGLSLSDKATISKVEDNKWLITDGELTYFVVKEKDKLNIYPPEPDKVEITFYDVYGNVKFEDVAPSDTGENKYVWDGNGLPEGAYRFRIAALDEQSTFLAKAFGSVIIDVTPPEIKNVFVSLSPFSPNGDGINDITEISFDLSGTFPPGSEKRESRQTGKITFLILEEGDPSATLDPQPLIPNPPIPIGVRLAPWPENVGGEIRFTINGSYKGAAVPSEANKGESEFIIHSGGITQLGANIYDIISSISDIDGPEGTHTAILDWFTGNAVVNIYSSDGKHIQTMAINPVYNGDRDNYHVRWGPMLSYDDGVYIYRILAEDIAGNVSQKSGQIILNNSTLEISGFGTSLPRIAPANPQYQKTVITYNLSKDSIVTIKILDFDGNPVKTLVGGEFQKAGAQSKVLDGKDIAIAGEEVIYNYVITSVDPLTSDTVKASGNIVVDDKGPEAPVLKPISPYTNKDTITVSGIAELGATIKISVGNFQGEVTASTTTGEFSLSNVPLKEEWNTIMAEASDSVGNKSDSSSLDVQLDKIPPVTTISDVQLDKIPPVTIVGGIPKGWQNESVTVYLKVNEGGSGVLKTYYSIDGSLPVEGTKVTFDEDGSYLLRFYSQDNAGNIESMKQAADYIRIDKTPPTIQINPREDEDLFEDFFKDLPIIIISGTAHDKKDDKEGSGVKLVEIQITPLETPTWLVVSGTSNWLYSFIPEVIPDDGTYNVLVRCTDNAGNQKEVPGTITLKPESLELKATPISGGRIRLTWKDEGGKYKIYRANSPGFVPDDSKNLVASVVSGGVWVDSNTTDQTEYYYKIGRDAQNAASQKEIRAVADKTPPAIENISATPNSFSPNNDNVDDITTISFTLTEETFVTLRIYATGKGTIPILGEVKRELVYGILPAGDNLIEWDGRDNGGKLVDEGTYVYRFEKASTLDAAGNALLQDISGTVTCILAPPLEVTILEAQPNPFSPNGDKINDVINLNYTLSDFADYVTVNIFDTSGGSQGEIIAHLKAEAFEYYFDGVQWVPIHFKDGIPSGRSNENYYLQPVDPKNSSRPPFGILDRPDDAQTIDGYLANYQAYNPNWRPASFTIQWSGQGATGSGAYVYQIAAAKSSGISSVEKTGVILLEGLVVVPDDKTPPTVVRTYPQKNTVHSVKLEFVSADLDDGHGTGADLTASTIRLIGPNGTVPGRQSNDGVNTITWTLNEGLAADGSADGPYSISVLPVDHSKNRTLDPQIFPFKYNMSVTDVIPPYISDAIVELESGPPPIDIINIGEKPINGDIARIKVTIVDEKSGVNLSASSINLLDPTSTVVIASRGEDRISGQLILHTIVFPMSGEYKTSGNYKLRIQPVDNAGNVGRVIEYVFKYITVTDDKEPQILDAPAFTSEEGTSITLNEGDFINSSIYSLTIDVIDVAPSSGIDLNPASTKIQLHSASGVKGFISYENQSVTQDGAFSVTIRLTLENPLSKDGSDDGDYTVTVTTFDNAENLFESVPVTFKYDTIAPSVRDIIPSPDKSILNALPEISITLEDNPNGSGIDEDASDIYLLGPDGNRIPAIKEKGGQEGEIILLPPDQSFVAADGLYTMVAIPKDEAGNAGAKASAVFLLDRKPPSVISMIPERGSSVNGEASQIQITFYDENGLNFKHTETKLEIMPPPESIVPEQPLEGKLVSVSAPANSLLFQLTVPLSINGVYAVRGKVADQAGNLQVLEELTPPLFFIFDDIAPKIESVSAVTGTGNTPLSEGKVISETISRVKVDVSDLTSGMDLKRTKILLKEETGQIVPGTLYFYDKKEIPIEINEETTIDVIEKTTVEWIVNDVQTLEPGVYKVEVEATDMAQNVAQKEITFVFSPEEEPRFNPFIPEILSITPKNEERFNSSISQVIVVVKDNSGTGINFKNSTITVKGVGVSTKDYQSNNGVDTLFWNFANPLATDHSDDGEYEVTIEVVDKASNSTGKITTTFTYDTIPPQVKTGSTPKVVPEPGAVINTADLRKVSVALEDPSGIDLDKSTIQLKGPKGAQMAQKTDNGIDTLILEFAPLKRDGSDDGEYIITVTPVDKVGNVAKFPLEFTFIYDTSPPLIRTLTPPADSIVVSPIDAVSVALDDGKGSGVDLAGSSVRLIRLADKQIIQGKQSDNGVDTITLSFAKLSADGSANGIYRMEVIPKDLLGNLPAKPITFDFTYTVTAPLLVSTTPADSAVLNTPIERVTAVLQDRSGKGLDFSKSNLTLSKLNTLKPPSGVEISGALTHTQNTLVLTLSRLLATDGRDDSNYLISVKAADLAGSKVSYSVSFTYDTQPPYVSYVNPAPNKVTNESISFVSAKLVDVNTKVDLEKSSITLKGPKGAVSGRQTNDGIDTIKWEFTPLLGGAGGRLGVDGVYTIEVVPVDQLGNKAFTPSQFKFNFDSTPPTVSTNPGPDAFLTSPISSVSAILDDGIGSGVNLSTSRIMVSGPSGVLRGTEVNNGINTIIFQFNSPLATDGSADGDYTIEVIAQDILGNVSDQLKFSFEYKPRVPVLVKISPENKAKFNSSIDVVSAVLSDQTESGLNLAESNITVVGPGVSPDDVHSNNGVDSLLWVFKNPLATDGTDDGKYTVTITAVTKSGLSITSTSTFIYDTKAPVVTKTTPQDGDILTTSISEVTATLSDAVNSESIGGFAGVDLDKSTIQLQGPSGSVKGRQTNNGVDTIRFEFESLAIDGEYTIQVKPRDILGNSTPLSKSFNFKFDTTPPIVVSTNPEDKAIIVSPISRVSVTLDDTTPLLGGSSGGSKGAGVDLEKSIVKLIGPNGLVKGSAGSDGINTIFWNFDAFLAADGTDDGTYTITVTPVDKKGNAVKTALRFGFTYTTKAPGIVSTTPRDGAFLNAALNNISTVLKDNSGKGLDWESTTVALTGPDDQPVSGIVDKDNQSNTITLTFDNRFAIDGSDDGRYTMTIVAADNTGVRVEYTRKFTYDTTPPSISKTSALLEEKKVNVDLVAGSTIKLNESILEVSAVLFDRGVGVNLVGSTIKLTGPKGPVSGLQTNDGMSIISLKFQPLATDHTSDGLYTVTVTPKDILGNVAVTAKSFDFLYDTTPPRVVKTTPKDGEGIVSPIDSVSVVLDDGGGVGIDFVSSKVSLEGPKGLIKVEQTSNGLDTITLSFEPLPIDIADEGDYFIHIGAFDLLGNSKSTSVTFTYKPTAPSIKKLSLDDGALLNQPPSEISVVLEAQTGAEINLDSSRIQLFNPQGASEPGKLTDNNVDTLYLKLDAPPATDGADDGWYTIKVTAMDNRGNSIIYTAKFLYDTTAPEVMATIPENGSILKENINSISAILKDELAGVDLTGSAISLPGVKGKQQNDGVDTIKLSFSQLPGDAIYKMTISPKDVLGNALSEPISFNFRLDTTPPTVTSVEPSDGAILVNTRLFQIKAALDDGQGSGIDLSKSTIQLTGPRGEITGEIPPQSPLFQRGEGRDSNTLVFALNEPLTLSGADDGKYTIKIVAVDEAGNSAEPFLSSFVYDTIQPNGPKLSNISTLPVSFSPNGDGASDTMRISFALSKKAKVTISVYKGQEGEGARGQEGQASLLVRTLLDSKEMNEGENSLVWDGTSDNGDVLLDRAYTMMFDVKDADGLTGALESTEIFIDTQSPIISNLAVSNNPFTPDGDGFADVTRISFSMTNSAPQDNVAVIIYDAQAKQIVSLPVEPKFAGNGNYSATWNGLYADYDGEYTYEVIAKDLANNIRTLSGKVVLDRNAPSIKVVKPESSPFGKGGRGDFAVATNQVPLLIVGTATDFSGIRRIEAFVSEATAGPVWRQVMFSGDGIDNDLDGAYDEEEYNRKDDDGDGRVDEDLRANVPSSGGVGVGSIIPNSGLPVDWIYKFEPKSDGKYIFSIRAIDNVGHITSESDYLTVTVDYDTIPPKHLSTTAFRNGKTSVKYKNSDEIKIVSKWDAQGYKVTADFSEIDSTLFEGLTPEQTSEIPALDNGDGSYTLRHQISLDNKMPDGMKTARITAEDAASNKTVIDAITIELDNTPPKIILFRPTESIYKNGGLISLTLTCDSADYEVSADFSSIDSTYAPKSEKVTKLGDNSYTIKYQISGANTRPDVKSLPIAISVFDGVNTITDKSFTVELDNTPPSFISASTRDKVLSNGMTAVLTVAMDSPGYKLLANFSRLDSKYAQGSEIVTDNEDKTYTVKYTISKENSKEDTKNALIQFKAVDAVGNAKEYSFSAILNNVAPIILRVSSQDEDTIYKNNDVINLLIQTDATGYKVKADFSFLDSQYEPGDEKITDKGDGTYIVSYKISEENTKGAKETLENLPVIIAVSDESYTSIYDAFTLQLDNYPPTIDISSPSEEKPVTTTAKIKITGKTEALSIIKIAPAPVESSYNADTGEFSFTLDLKRGENRITLQAMDLAGNKTVKELLIIYRPIISETVSAIKGGEIVLPEEVDDRIIDNDTKIIIPPSALPYDAVVSITLVKDALPTPDNPQIVQDNATPLAAYRISTKSVNGKDIPGVLLKPAILVLQFSAESKKTKAAPIVDATFDIERLKVFRWDGVHWNKIGGKAQRNNTVIVKVDNISGLFAIFEIKEAPQVFKVEPPHPNPFTPNGDMVNDFVEFHFENPQGLEPIIRIYDLRGALLRELTDVGTTSATWDGKDEDGELLELGLYIYQIKVGDKVGGGTVVLAR